MVKIKKLIDKKGDYSLKKINIATPELLLVNT
jgi:hypothetical protein